VTTKITNHRKNLPKSRNQNHKGCVTKSPNKRQQKITKRRRGEPGITFGAVQLNILLSTLCVYTW